MKEFLKPTLGKIILTLILFVLFIPFIMYSPMITSNPIPIKTVSLTIFLISGNTFFNFGINYTNLVLGLIILYLISCKAIILFKKRNN